MVDRKGSSSSAGRSGSNDRGRGAGGRGQAAEAVWGGGSVEAGRSSGDDSGRVVQRSGVAFVEKSVGAGRDEAGPEQVDGGHREKRMEWSGSDQVGGGWKPHLARFMQGCDLIGEAAPDHCAGLGLSLGEEELAGPAGVAGLASLSAWVQGPERQGLALPLLRRLVSFRFVQGCCWCLLTLTLTLTSRPRNQATGSRLRQVSYRICANTMGQYQGRTPPRGRMGNGECSVECSRRMRIGAPSCKGNGGKLTSISNVNVSVSDRVFVSQSRIVVDKQCQCGLLCRLEGMRSQATELGRCWAMGQGAQKALG